jgi:hypothetical protein
MHGSMLGRIKLLAEDGFEQARRSHGRNNRKERIEKSKDSMSR